MSGRIENCRVAAYLNIGLELTAYSVRCAPASGSSSGLALCRAGVARHSDGTVA